MAEHDERPGLPGHPDDAPSAGEPDQTRAFEPLSDEAGGAAPRPDATAPLPPPDLPGGRPAEPAAWSGRAAVPPAGGGVRESVPTEWIAADEPPGRRWWLPILVGILALVLLAVLAYGLWLIAQSRDREEPVTPSPSPSGLATAPTVATPTSAAPSTAQPTPTPSATSAASVVVPPVIGLPESAATALLDQVGLEHHRRFRESDQPSGTVIDADPRPGTPVAPGTRVTIVVAKAPDKPPTTAPPTPAPTGTAAPGTTG